MRQDQRSLRIMVPSRWPFSVPRTLPVSAIRILFGIRTALVPTRLTQQTVHDLYSRRALSFKECR
jgi:hypothetical protein